MTADAGNVFWLMHVLSTLRSFLVEPYMDVPTVFSPIETEGMSVRRKSFGVDFFYHINGLCAHIVTPSVTAMARAKAIYSHVCVPCFTVKFQSFYRSSGSDKCG